MKKSIFIWLFFFFCAYAHAQQDIFTSIDTYDTTEVKKYLQNGGDVDAFKVEKLGLSSFKLKRIKYKANLFEMAVQAIRSASAESDPFNKVKAYRNLYLLLEHIDRSKNKKELLDRVFSLSIALGDVDLTRKINELGADFNYRCMVCYGRTPILIALAYNENFEMIKFLLSLKPDLTITDFDGKNALHISAQLGNFDMVKYFISNKIIDINTPDKTNKTPVMYAAAKGNYEIFNYLVEKGADLKVVSKRGVTVLHGAAQSDDVDFFRHVHYVSQLPLWSTRLKDRDVYQFSGRDDANEEAVALYITRYTIKQNGERYYKKRKRKLFWKKVLFWRHWWI